MIRTPWRSSKSRISRSGTAAPPQIIRRMLERSGFVSSATRRTSSQIVGTPPASVTFSDSISFASGSPWRKRPGITRSAPTRHAAYGNPHALTWNIGTTGSTRSDDVMPDRVGHRRGQAVEDVRPVRVEDALRVAGRPARVAEAGGLALVQLGPVEARLLGGQQLLVAQHVRQRARIAVAVHDEVLDVLELVRQRREQRDQRVVDDDHLVARVVDDVDELLREQPDVQRVQHGAHVRHREVHLEVLLRVPHERRDAVLGLHAELRQRRGELVGPLPTSR